jgi:uncharacterized protein YlxW (UPF0749 family)
MPRHTPSSGQASASPIFSFHGNLAPITHEKLSYARRLIFPWDTMSSIRQAKKYTAKVNEHQISAKKLAKAAKFRAKAAKLREQVAKHDAKIRTLQRKIADLERRANQIAGPPLR